MTVQLNIEGEIDDVLRSLNRHHSSDVPKSSARALNKAGGHLRTHTARRVSKEIRIAQKRVKKRFDRNGNKKGDRFGLHKATRTDLAVLFTAYLRGIPAIQLGSVRQTKRGVKAEGGRFYRGAFINPVRRSGQRHVLRRETPDAPRYPLRVLKVPLSGRIRRQAEALIDGASGEVFRKEFARLMRVEFQRRGLA